MVDSAYLSDVLARLGGLLDVLDLLARLLTCFLFDVFDLIDGFDCCFLDSPLLLCFVFCVVLLLDFFLLGAADFASLVVVDACTTLKGSVGVVDLFNVKVPKLLVACTTLNWSMEEVETAGVRRAVDGVAVAVGLEACWTKVVCLVSNFCDPEERIVISISNSIVSFSIGV